MNSIRQCCQRITKYCIIVSFDTKSLLTSISLQLALQCTETAIQQSTVRLPLPTEDTMDLLNLCLTSTSFQYNGKHYKQLHGTAMGSPRLFLCCRRNRPIPSSLVSLFQNMSKCENEFNLCMKMLLWTECISI